MIINELIERECCDSMKFDLQPDPYKHKRSRRPPWYEMIFTCKHCGQEWKWESYMDAAGGRSKRLVKEKSRQVE